MTTTIEQFVKAFSGNVSKDAFTARDKKLEAALKLLKAKVAELEKAGAPSEGFKQDLVALVARYDAAKKQATPPKKYIYDELSRSLDDTATQTAAVASILAQVAEYDQQKKKAEAAVDQLEKLKNADAVDKEFRKAKYDLASAEGLAKGGKYAEAARLLKVVIDDCATADTKARILKGDAPKQADFEALMKKSGGAKRLDKLILELPDELQQKVFTTAIAARFGLRVEVYETAFKRNADGSVVRDKDDKPVKLEEWQWKGADKSKPNKSMKGMYEMLTKVPESHASHKQNKNLDKIVHFTEDSAGAWYRPSDDGVYMTVNRGTGKGMKNVTDEVSTGKIMREKKGEKIVLDMFPDGRDSKCLPRNTDVETSFFDWAALHEVGHSVDDKFGFMKEHGKDSAYGGWKIVKVADIAKLAADKFQWYQAYVQAKLGGKETPDDKIPEKHKEAADWKTRKKQVDDWCADVTAMDAWWDGTKAKRICDAIGDGRVYQKAYEWEWNSYDYAARRKGIHGYQFRAQYEWFAELYAAYYAGKLQDGHPAVSWLKDLESPQKKK